MRKSLKAVSLALCFGCFSLSVSSASAPSVLASPDDACEGSAVTSTQQEPKLAERGTVEGSNTQNEGLSQRNEPGSAQLLDDEELAQLAARAEEPGQDVVGGALTNQQLTYIMIALAAAVLVLIAK